MELRQIKYFIEVAKREHVTEAAEALNVAQSAVSRQIFNLEAELGVELFIRKGRNIKLTTIGKEFLKHMEQAMNTIDRAVQIVNEFTDPEQGTIQIGFPSSLATYMLPKVISAFRKQYPHVKFLLHQSSYYGLSEAVADGEVNIALLGPVPKDTPDWIGTILFTENIVALLPNHHRLAKRPYLTLHELKDEAFVLFPEGYILRDMIVRDCQRVGFTPKVSFEGEDIDSIKGLVSAGLGISLIPEITLVDNVPRTTSMIPIREPSMTRTVGMIIPRDRSLLPAEQLFYEFLKDYFKRLEKFQY